MSFKNVTAGRGDALLWASLLWYFIVFYSIFRVVLSFFNTFSIHEGIRSERQEIQVVRRMMVGSDELWDRAMLSFPHLQIPHQQLQKH